MNTLDDQTVSLLHELNRMLDQEIALLEKTRSQFDRMARIVLDRDEETLETLMEEIAATHRLQQQTEQKLFAIRTTLAGFMKRPMKKMRLAHLVQELPRKFADPLKDRRKTLLDLTEQVRRSHTRAATVITECARVNRMLLENLFPNKQAVTTYGAGGQSTYGLDVGLVDMES